MIFSATIRPTPRAACASCDRRKRKATVRWRCSKTSTAICGISCNSVRALVKSGGERVAVYSRRLSESGRCAKFEDSADAQNTASRCDVPAHKADGTLLTPNTTSCSDPAKASRRRSAPSLPTKASRITVTSPAKKQPALINSVNLSLQLFDCWFALNPW